MATAARIMRKIKPLQKGILSQKRHDVTF